MYTYRRDGRRHALPSIDPYPDAGIAPTSDQLANALGLKEEIQYELLVTGTAKIFKGQGDYDAAVMLYRRDLINNLQKANDLFNPMEYHSPVFNEFCSQHLPTLVKAYLALPKPGASFPGPAQMAEATSRIAPEIRNIYTCWFLSSLYTSYGWYWLRSYGDVKGFFQSEVKMLELTDAKELNVSGIHGVWKLVLLHHPSIFDSVLLSLPADAKETIRAKFKVYLSAPDPRLPDQSMMGSTVMLATMVLDWLNSGGGAGDGRRKRVGDKDILVMAGPEWDLCAGGVDSAVHMEYFVDGHRKPKESFRCGRCYSVCYCSREHQKKHWKSHKALCFKPSFGSLV